MRIGIVVDSACDVPADFIQDEHITILPVTVQIGNAVLADMRNEEATLNFLTGDTAAQAYNAETTPYTVQQVHDLFLSKLVLDYDYVFCICTTRSRSGRLVPTRTLPSATSANALIEARAMPSGTSDTVQENVETAGRR